MGASQGLTRDPVGAEQSVREPGAGGERRVAYAHRVASSSGQRSHAEATRVLRRAGYSDEFISEVLGQLPDPFDPERDHQVLARYGLSAERLMDLLGGSP
jgi:hypothetical protein